MTWSDNLKVYLENAGATYTYACLHTIDGTNCFAEVGGDKKAIKPAEVAAAVKSVSGDQKHSGLTFAGDKFFYLIDDSGVFCFKKSQKSCLFFHGAAFTFAIFGETEPRVLMSAVLKVKADLAGAGLA